MELFGDLRMRYEYRSAQLGQEAGPYAGAYDAARTGGATRCASGCAATWPMTFITDSAGDFAKRAVHLEHIRAAPATSPYYGPFSKSSYSLYMGLAYLGWRPTSWLDVSIGRVPQPLYTTPMVWDSDYTPEGVVEKLKYTYGPVDYFATLGQYVYQDVTPANAYAVEGGSIRRSFWGAFPTKMPTCWPGSWGRSIMWILICRSSWRPFSTIMWDMATGAPGITARFVGQGINGFTFDPNFAGGTTSSTLPGGYTPPTGNIQYTSYNQTGINDLSIIEFPMEVNFKIGSLDARAFGDFSINLEGDDRARAAYNAVPGAFPGGLQLNQNQAMQFGMAVGNNLDLVYGSAPKKGTWEARAYWQHVEQYALDPNLLDSDFFEGRGNLQGLYAALAYSFTDAIIGTVRYGVAQRINNQLGTGGYNADLPLPNPINRYQLVQVDATWKF